MSPLASSPRPRARTAVLLACFLVPLAAAAPTEALAQVRLVPGVGLYAPLADLGEVRDETGQRLIDAGRRNSTVAFSLGVEFGERESPLGLRLRADYGTRARVPIAAVDCPDCTLRSTLAAGSVDLLLRPLPRLLVLQPFVAAGVGVKRYDLDRDDLEREGFGAFRSQTRPSLRAGAGAQLFFGGLRPQVEASVLVSRFEAHPEAAHVRGHDRVQSDLFVTLSLPFGGP